MTWRIEFTAGGRRSFRRLDRPVRVRIQDFLENRLARAPDPRAMGNPMRGARFRGLHRYRVGDYRIVAEIDGERVRIVVVRVGHRRDVYR